MINTKRSPHYPLKRLSTFVRRRDGRPTIGLGTPSGRQKQISISRLLALTYIGPPPAAKSVVRHLNGDHTDNRLENLAWGSHADNMADARRHGSFRNERNPRARLTVEIVRDARQRWATGCSMASLAREYNVCEGTIYHAVRGLTWRGI